MKSYRVRKSNYATYIDGFDFLSSSKFDPIKIQQDSNLITLVFISKDKQQAIKLSKVFETVDVPQFIKHYERFLGSEDYFFDLADFSRENLT